MHILVAVLYTQVSNVCVGYSAAGKHSLLVVHSYPAGTQRLLNLNLNFKRFDVISTSIQRRSNVICWLGN